MAMHTELQIHKTAEELLSLTLSLVRNIPRDLKQVIRKAYSVPCKRGGQVIYRGRGTEERGTITSAKGAHLMIKLDGESKPRKFHPTWELQYLSEQA